MLTMIWFGEIILGQINPWDLRNGPLEKPIAQYEIDDLAKLISLIWNDYIGIKYKDK